MKYHSSEQFTLYNGNSKQILPTLPENSIDSIVTDPPYELGFMGKSWDSTGVANDVNLWKEVLRVLKPGGYLLSFGGSRTYHRMAVAIEDAGFEIRDQIMWVYGSGFPKSHNISKGIDKAAGAEREVIGSRKAHDIRNNNLMEATQGLNRGTMIYEYTKAATPAAQQWDGWGTALKPAHEPIVLARKPLIGTIAKNVLIHGTGGLNIDGSRVGRAEGDDSVAGSRTATFGTQETESGGDGSGGWEQNTGGRWPANFIHDGSDEVVELFPNTGSVKPERTGTRGGKGFGFFDDEKSATNQGTWPADTGGSAARFFYCAKAGKRDRNEGCDNLADKEWKTDGAAIPERENRPFLPSKNNHPTVKPTDLMQYLCRLITPPNGTILDPFLGSGSTGKAAMYEGFKFVGIELTDEYLPIAKARIEFALSNLDEKLF